MEVDIITYRIRIGSHYCRHHRLKGVNCLYIFEYYVFIRMLLLRAGDIELNPGPDSDNDFLLSDASLETSDIIKNIFSLVHYNVQSAARKIDLLESELSCFDVQSSQRNTLHPCAHELHMGCTTGELALSDELHLSLKP